MAVYVSAGRQRRHLILAGIAALIVGLVVGLLIGRSTASGLDDAINASKEDGRKAAAALRALPLEYEQAATSSLGEDTERIGDAVRRVDEQVKATLAKSTWLGPGDRERVTTAVEAVVAAAAEKAPPTDFEKVVETAANEVEDVFNVPT